MSVIWKRIYFASIGVTTKFSSVGTKSRAITLVLFDGSVATHTFCGKVMLYSRMWVPFTVSVVQLVLSAEMLTVAALG